MIEPRVSIIVPCLNEVRYIEKVLHAILLQDYPVDKMEIFIVDGMSTDGTREIIQKYSAANPMFQMLDNPGRTTPKALNIGLKKFTGDVFVRIDAHCNYPTHYITTLIRELYALPADNVGVACRTHSGSETAMSLAIAVAMAHSFGVGNSAFRTGISETRKVDTVPFGCYRREVFERIGLFDEELTRNQDDEFNARLINAGGKIFIIGGLHIDYFARETLGKAAQMFFQYGLFKPLVNKKLGKAATWRQFIPPLFVAAWLLAIIWALFSSYFPFVPMLSFGIVYGVPSVFFGCMSAYQNKKPVLIFLLPLVFAAFHFAYGMGYWKGIFRFYLFLRKEPISLKHNR